MKEMAKAIRSKVSSFFEEMSGHMMDAGEKMGEPMEISASDEDRRYYPSISVPVMDGHYKLPGETCNIVAVGEVESINEDSMNIKVKKIALLPEEVKTEDE